MHLTCCISFRSSEFAAAKEEFDSRIQRQKAVLAKLDPEVLMSKLAKAGRDADDEAETQYNEFVAGTLPLEAFVTAYSKKKIAAHCRHLKSTAAAQTLR